MSTVIRHSETCQIKMAKSSKTIEAVVSRFIFQESLDVVLNKSVQLKLRWNGKCYEGKSAGMDIESAGPIVTQTQTGIRG